MSLILHDYDQDVTMATVMSQRAQNIAFTLIGAYGKFHVDIRIALLP